MSIVAEGEECHAKSSGLSSKFQRLYKAASPSAPSWKDAYRKRCQERLANSRQSLLERFRWNVDSSTDDVGSARTSAIRDLVLSEWKAFRQENYQQMRADEAINVECAEDEFIDVESDDVDSLLSVVEEVTAELLREEEQILAEYEARNQFDDEALCASISRLTTDELICPICTKSPLFVNKGVVFCRCGVRINTEQDAVTLDMVRENLDAAVSDHSRLCEKTAIFAAVQHPGINNLMMTCEACDFMFIIV